MQKYYVIIAETTIISIFVYGSAFAAPSVDLAP